MDKSKIREGVIRAAWKGRGSKLWNPETHGKGFPLTIPAKLEATTIAAVPRVTSDENLEFHFFCATGRSQSYNYIVCEGIVVETWGEHELPRFIISRPDA
jgi:hypothetical protein